MQRAVGNPNDTVTDRVPSLEELVREIINAVYARTGENVSETARLLGIDRKTEPAWDRVACSTNQVA